jgi:glycosyltransferase involved in cell wall biosynthesis
VFAKDNLSTNAKGGTELMKSVLSERIDKNLQDNFQIFLSRVHEDLDTTKIRLYWAHDLPNDPEAENALGKGKWDKFHKIIFVSNWQQQQFISKFNIPWHKTIVIQNAINPIEEHVKPLGPIRLGYWSTPHRGLNILLPVFEKLAEDFDVELNVFSSFKLYGWEDKDKEFEVLFDQARKHPKINYHGTVSNEVIRENIKNIHILAYPSIWPETSCITLLEAMSGGCLPVHSNLGALPETAANWNLMYNFDERPNDHAGLFYSCLRSAVEEINEDQVQARLRSAKSYTDLFYGWNGRIEQWNMLLNSLLNEPRELPKEVFRYSSR